MTDKAKFEIVITQWPLWFTAVVERKDISIRRVTFRALTEERVKQKAQRWCDHSSDRADRRVYTYQHIYMKRPPRD